MSKNVAVLFSGGLDSTYLVYKNLMNGNRVYPYYAQIMNNSNKCQMESHLIMKIYHELQRQFHNSENHTSNLECPTKIGEIEVNVSIEWRIIQPQIWTFFLSMLQYNKDISEFQIAYIKDDDAPDVLKHIKKLHNSFRGFPANNNKFIPLKFPLLKYDKYKLMKLLPENYSQLVFSCESPSCDNGIYLPCGTCHTCLIYEIISRNDPSIKRTNFPYIYNHKNDNSSYIQDKDYMKRFSDNSKYSLK